MRSSSNIFISMLAFFYASICFGQDMNRHKWKNRILVIAAKEGKQLEEQIRILSKDTDGLAERKLIIYKVLPDKFSEGINNQSWTKNKKFYAELKKKKSDLEVILIGLDGGVKLRQTKTISTEKLFTLIDGMPMRQREIKN